MDTDVLTGLWKSRYFYHDQTATSQHVVRLKPAAGEYIGTSEPQADGSQLTLRLKYDPGMRTLTGTWHETTSLTGAYKGKAFHGALQLILDGTGTKAAGKWVGFNSSHQKVNDGDWTLERLKNK